eukprot:scaffold27748_cov70-Cyclotella_meneghiniana.AAC.3
MLSLTFLLLLLWLKVEAQDNDAVSSLSASLSLAKLRLHETTVIASHNAHANRAAADSFFETLGINQEHSIYHQLSVDGVRALLLDIKLDDNELRMVHGPLDYGGFHTEMEKNLVPFLEENDDAIVMLYLQTIGDVNTGDDVAVRAAILSKLQEAFDVLIVKNVPLRQLTFKYDDELWSNHDEWPTVEELRSANQRLIIVTDRSEFISTDYGFMHNRQVLRENDWRGITSCLSRYNWQSNTVSLPTNTRWTRLFFMNHWCCDSGAESYGSTITSETPLLGGGDNGWGVLLPRIIDCMTSNGGAKPNFIALDWVLEGEQARGIARYLNFGGSLGVGQACDSDDKCATSSCNDELRLCQCQSCNVDGCGGCDSGQICLSSIDGLNECKSIQSKQEEGVTIQQEQEGLYYCGETYFDSVENCTSASQCRNGNSDCPENQVCFGPFECTTQPGINPQELPTSQPFSSAPESLAPSPNSVSPSQSNGTTQLTIEDLLSQRPPMEPSTAPFPTTSSPTTVTTTNPPVTPTTLYCGVSYENAKETCSDETACPGGYECPSGQVCFQGIKCFTRPPSVAPTTQPTTLPPTSDDPREAPSGRPTTAPVTPTKSPTDNPTKQPFDFSNEFFCGANYTDAQEACYSNAPCPDGDPTPCGVNQTCYSGIKCIAPPSFSPTVVPSLAPLPNNENATSMFLNEENIPSASYTTSAPFIWPESSGERINLNLSKTSNITIALLRNLSLIKEFEYIHWPMAEDKNMMAYAHKIKTPTGHRP